MFKSFDINTNQYKEYNRTKMYSYMCNIVESLYGIVVCEEDADRLDELLKYDEESVYELDNGLVCALIEAMKNSYECVDLDSLTKLVEIMGDFVEESSYIWNESVEQFIKYLCVQVIQDITEYDKIIRDVVKEKGYTLDEESATPLFEIIDKYSDEDERVHGVLEKIRETHSNDVNVWMTLVMRETEFEVKTLDEAEKLMGKNHFDILNWE